jgi:hypothetical protein
VLRAPWHYRALRAHVDEGEWEQAYSSAVLRKMFTELRCFGGGLADVRGAQ